VKNQLLQLPTMIEEKLGYGKSIESTISTIDLKDWRFRVFSTIDSIHPTWEYGDRWSSRFTYTIDQSAVWFHRSLYLTVIKLQFTDTDYWQLV